MVTVYTVALYAVNLVYFFYSHPLMEKHNVVLKYNVTPNGYRNEKSMVEWTAFNNSASGNDPFSYRRMRTKSACTS